MSPAIMAQDRYTGRSGGAVRHASANGQATSAPGVGPLAVAISRVLTSGSRSRPRWLMALADCNAAEILGAFDAGIGYDRHGSRFCRVQLWPQQGHLPTLRRRALYA